MSADPVVLQKCEFTGADTDSPHLLITGGVHGDEFEPMAAIRRLIEAFENNDTPTATLRGKVTLVPVVNENAFLRGHRCADDDLDLARTCPGRPDGSITERTAHALTELISQADYYIDLHTGGTELSVYPLAGYGLVDDAEVLEVQRRMAKAFNLPVVWGTSGKLDGRSMSVARDAGVPAIYAEHHGSAVCGSQGVADYVNGCWNVMVELDMITRSGPVPDSRIRHVVEDPRPESGYMQICNPSPMDGYFEPAVKLGERVEQGDTLGLVCNVLGKERRSVAAEESGIVIVLRTFPRVHEGESLGVVMEKDTGTNPT